MKFYNLWHKFLYFLKRLIAPPFCVHCRIYLDDYLVFCKECLKLISPVVSMDLILTQAYKITVLAASDYKDPLRYLVLHKFRNNIAFAVQLAHLIWALSNLKNITFDYLVPIPLHWTRKLWRGYNQSEIIAQELSKLSGKPLFYGLKRIKRTQYQTHLNVEERHQNLFHAFEINNAQDLQSGAYSGKTFMIVDDVMTTGSTLKAAGKVLLNYKPQSLYAIVACRVVR